MSVASLPNVRIVVGKRLVGPHPRELIRGDKQIIEVSGYPLIRESGCTGILKVRLENGTHGTLNRPDIAMLRDILGYFLATGRLNGFELPLNYVDEILD